MKMCRKTIAIFSILVIFLTVLPNLATRAQTQLGGGEGDPDAPIDGGVSLLIAAGIGYGIKKNKERKNNNNNKDVEM
jgi:hypothetical protein